MVRFSREPPKQIVKLVDGETLIEKTYARAKALSSEVLAVTNRDYYLMSRDEKERVVVNGTAKITNGEKKS